MKTFLKIIAVCLFLGGLGAAVAVPAVFYFRQRMKPLWRTVDVARGDIVSVVNSTGTIKPVQSVAIGSFVSGPILKIYCGFNQEVKEGELLAEIDPRIYLSAVAQNKALVATRQAEVLRTEARLQLAKNDEKRAMALRAKDPDFIAQADIDKVSFNRMALEAELQLAKTGIDQAQATLENAEANLEYTKIKSPVDGIVTVRKIDPGQTLAAQFQTPELFTIAPDLRKKVHVHASVDEADIGLISEAKKKGLPVRFTVDAYPDDLFSAEIEEVRLNYTTTQNVVTYPVIVAATNPELKLLPGMTASVSFNVDERKGVLRVPNSALRFFPTVEQVRQEDRKLVEGVQDVSNVEEEVGTIGMSAEERSQLRNARNRRHVWVADGDKLRAIALVVGLSDSKFTEVVEGELTEGQKLVTGIRPPGAPAVAASE